MGVELPLCVVVTILECCVTFSGVKLSIRSFVLLLEQKTIISHDDEKVALVLSLTGIFMRWFIFR